MCATCGCDANASTSIKQIGEHDHGHDHHHDHSHTHGKTIVEVEKDVLHENNLLAERNRGYFDAKNIFAMNLVSSPGSGKTSLLERTLTDLKDAFSFYVIEQINYRKNCQ